MSGLGTSTSSLVLDSGLIYNRNLRTIESSLKRLIEAYNRRARARY